jgi:hypothetical protein
MTITLGTASATSTAPAAGFFARWIHHDSWGEWSPDTEWVRLDGPVALGATGVIKPTGGPKTRFTISALEPDHEYTDTSFLPGAKLVFQHLVTERSGRTELDVAVSMTGPLAWLWARVMGGGFRESTKADLDRLVALVEAEQLAAR